MENTQFDARSARSGGGPLRSAMFQRMARAALAALAHETRLAIFTRLAHTGPGGEPAGTLASGLGLAGPTLSFHLKELDRAGLVSAKRLGRKVIYSANIGAMRAVIDFLARDCAGLSSR